jgi:hypothetical protein
MHLARRFSWVRILGIGSLVLAVVFAVGACKGKEEAKAPAEATEKIAAPAPLTLETVAGIMGQAEIEKSGVYEVNSSAAELQITFHCYVPNEEEIADDIGTAMAPKIRELYAKLKDIDRVLFIVQVWKTGADTDWKPFCTFVTTRKMINETDWTKLLDADFFKTVLELKFAE